MQYPYLIAEDIEMKIKYVALASMIALVGCSGSSLPDPSEQQALAAQKAYDDLRLEKFDDLMNHLEPELQHYFKNNERELHKFSRNLPKVDYRTRKIVAKNQQEDSAKPSKYTVTYEYGYEKNLVQYDVSFDKASGSSKIRDLNVSVFGESTK